MNKDGRALQVVQGCCSIIEGGRGAEDDQGLQKQATKLTAIKKKREIFDHTRCAKVEKGGWWFNMRNGVNLESRERGMS